MVVPRRDRAVLRRIAVGDRLRGQDELGRKSVGERADVPAVRVHHRLAVVAGAVHVIEDALVHAQEVRGTAVAGKGLVPDDPFHILR